MTIHVNAETVRQLVEKHVRNLYPGKLLGQVDEFYDRDEDTPYWTVEVLDQSPFDLPPEKVKAGFDRARDAINKLP